MELKSLRALLAVAENGSFSRAATALNTVQSNVTSHIQKLEAELDTVLFERAHRQVSLTWAGEQLRDCARQILTLHDDTRARLRHPGEPAGQLRLGSMQTAAAVRLPGLLAGYHHSYPEVALTLRTATSRELAAAVGAGELDAAFVAGIDEPALASVPAFRERLVLTAAPGHGGDLRGATLLVFPAGCTYRTLLETYLREQVGHDSPQLEFGTLDTILGCVAAGMGVTALPESTVEHHRERFALETYELPPTLATIDTHLVYRPERIRSPALQALLEMLQQTRATEEKPVRRRAPARPRSPDAAQRNPGNPQDSTGP